MYKVTAKEWYSSKVGCSRHRIEMLLDGGVSIKLNNGKEVEITAYYTKGDGLYIKTDVSDRTNLADTDKELRKWTGYKGRSVRNYAKHIANLTDMEMQSWMSEN